MKNKKVFFNQVGFSLAVLAFLLIIVALSLYAGNCASEFNGGKVSPNVITGQIIAIVFTAIVVAGAIFEYFLVDKPIVIEILKYRRFCLYIAFSALVYSFFMSILAEYSLIGTILYPIVSGTLGDPVDPVLSASYFSQLIIAFVAIILLLISAILQKIYYYKTDKAENGTENNTLNGKVGG